MLYLVGGPHTNQYVLPSLRALRNDTVGRPHNDSQESEHPSSMALRAWEGGPVPTSPHLKTGSSFL